MLSSYKKELANKGETYLRVKVRPNARTSAWRQALTSEDGEILKVDIASAPERGRANRTLLAFLAAELGVSSASLKILSGAATSEKLIKAKADQPSRSSL
jgi:uncharacterized protein YggU (UPF0235/DUF167 family)